MAAHITRVTPAMITKQGTVEFSKSTSASLLNLLRNKYLYIYAGYS